MATSINWTDVSPDLPDNFQENSFTESEKTANIKTAMDIGPSKVRRRYTTHTSIYSGSMLMDSSQKSAFKVFYQTTLRNGQYSFNFPNPSEAGYVEVKFNGVPSYKALENSYWNISFSLTQYGPPFLYVLYDFITESGDEFLTEDDDDLVAVLDL